MNKSMTPTILALAAVLLAAWAAFVKPDMGTLPQTIAYSVQEGRLFVEIRTPRWPAESEESWKMRHATAWKAWESDYGSTVLFLADRPERDTADDHR